MSLEEELSFNCPHCGAENSYSIDYSQGHKQQFVSDCEICCNPFELFLTIKDAQIIEFDVKKENE